MTKTPKVFSAKNKQRLLDRFLAWRPQGAGWLNNRKFYDSNDQDDMLQVVWHNTQCHLNRGNEINNPEPFFFKLLSRSFSKELLAKDKFGKATDPQNLPERCGEPDAFVEQRHDLEYLRCNFDSLIHRFAKHHPQQAAQLSLWIVENRGDKNKTANQLSGGTKDSRAIKAVKAKLSMAFCRFGCWLSANDLLQKIL